MHSMPLHMAEFSIQFNPNLDRGCTGCAILSNWGVNCYNRKFEWDIEKSLKVGMQKCNLSYFYNHTSISLKFIWFIVEYYFYFISNKI